MSLYQKQRVLVIGPCGSGKSTLSVRLGQMLGLPVVHLDHLYWSSGWVEHDKQQWPSTVRKAMGTPTWIMDGDYSGTLVERLDACDAVIFLDFSRLTCMWRVLRRIVRYRGRARPDMPAGCPERFDVAFLVWVWNYRSRTRPRVVELLKSLRRNQTVVRLRTPAEVEVFIDRLPTFSLGGPPATDFSC